MSNHTLDRRPRRRGSPWRALTALAGAAAMLTAMAVLIAPAASAADAGVDPLNTAGTAYNQSYGIPICHRTNSDSNPYVSESPDFDSIISKNGHDTHDGPIWSLGLKAAGTKWGDIIPSFYYVKNGVSGYYDGKNWTAAGKAIWDSKCKPAGTPAPSGPELVLVKSATPSHFSAAGQTITYTFTVTNTGDVEAKNVAVTDSWISGSSGSGTISAAKCPDPGKLAPGDSLTCTAKYTTTATDVSNGWDLVNTAFATAKPKTGPDTVRSNDDTATVTSTSTVQVNKIWKIGGKTYNVPGDTLPSGYSADLVLGGIASPAWGTVYGGFTPGSSVSVTESETVPPSCGDHQTVAGPQALTVGANVFTVTNDVTCAVAVTLTKNWVHPEAGSTDAVSLTIGGGSDAKGGVSHASADSGDTPATATAAQGAPITLTEAFTSGQDSDYDTALVCTSDSQGTKTVSAGQLSSSFTIPADALTVDCVFTNTSTKAAVAASTVNLTKIWSTPADAGNEVGLVVADTTTKAADASGTSINGGASSPSSLKVFPDDNVTISENAMGTTDLSHYDVTYTCTVYGGAAIDLAGGSSFTVPADLQPGSTIDCTITNTHKTLLTVTKDWVIGGTTYSVPQGAGAVLPAGYSATLTVNGTDTAWGAAVAVTGAPTIAEQDVTLADSANCTSVQSPIDLSHFAAGTDNTVTVTNTVTCTTPPDNNGGSNPGGNPGGNPGNTPAPTPSPQVLAASSSVTPPPAPPTKVTVKGVSREQAAPSVQVLGTSQSLAAPSANAHTGQGASPWVFVLLAAGVALMLGAAGIRRRGEA